MNNQELYNEIKAREIVPVTTIIDNLYLPLNVVKAIKNAESTYTLRKDVMMFLSGKVFHSHFMYLGWSSSKS